MFQVRIHTIGFRRLWSIQGAFQPGKSNLPFLQGVSGVFREHVFHQPDPFKTMTFKLSIPRSSTILAAMRLCSPNSKGNETMPR